VPALAIALVLVAAVLHAGWNVLLKTSGDTLSTAVRLQAIGSAVLVPIGVVAWIAIGTPPVAGIAVALAVVSGCLEAAYFVLLASAYRRGPLSLVYPLARGSAPLIAVAVGLLLLQERLAPLAFVGVGCLLVGMLLVSRPWQAFRASGATHRGAIGFALATGASIAGYSAVDRLGVRETEPWIYGSILAVVSTVLTTAAVVGGRRLGVLAPAPVPAGATSESKATGRGRTEARFGGVARDALAGVLSLAAYLLVLLAYSFAPLATVAPLRESGVVLAAAWGAFRLGEARGGRDASTKIAAAGLVVVGAILLAVAR
jgi:drug/metabolite transporter (DMT)-like permease